MDENEACGTCAGSVAISIAGTFLATCLGIALAGLIYRQWRRNKGKHLVLVTDPEIVEEAYAFDNPCFKDCTPAQGRSLERPVSLTTQSETVTTSPNVAKESNNRWSTPWSNLGKADKRRTLDDSCLGPKAKTVNVVALRSRDFTGLGFNVCGNMREGIFVKDLLHRGPASESGRINPGDRITSVKISFRSMVYEDALTILSYASPYDVEIEVEGGDNTSIVSKPTTLLKRSVGPSAAHLYHPLYRSHSIPDLTQQQQQQHYTHHQHSSSSKKLALGAKRLIFDPNESNNSTLKSSKSTPVTASSLDRRHDYDIKTPNHHHHHHHHPKFGIKVLPALDGTVHRIENQNEHNTNLERRHSKKLEFAEKRNSSNGSYATPPATRVKDEMDNGKALNGNSKRASENMQQRSAKKVEGIDVPDRASEIVKDNNKMGIPSQVPAEVHNAAMAARRNRKSSNIEILQQQMSTDSDKSQHDSSDPNEPKTPQKGKRKAPAPPARSNSSEIDDKTIITKNDNERTIDDKKFVNESMTKITSHRNSESDASDSGEINRRHHQPVNIKNNSSFTKIELNPSDITVHHTPLPESKPQDEDIEDEEDDADSVYRKAASLGDLSKYENKNTSTATTLERAQSLDMTDTAGGSKKLQEYRNKTTIPPPEDINESTEDLTKLDQIETFDRRKLKKSSEWGTLEDAIFEDKQIPKVKSESDDVSNIDKKEEKEEVDQTTTTSIELYNLPLSKKLTQDFIRSERLFDPAEDNALARLVNDGEVVKSPCTPEQMEFEFRMAHPPPDYDDDEVVEEDEEIELELETQPSPDNDDGFEKAVRYFELHAPKSSPLTSETKVSITEAPEELYAGRKEVIEEPITKVKRSFGCPGCKHHMADKHVESCAKKPRLDDDQELSYHQTIRVESSNNNNKKKMKSNDLDEDAESKTFETHFAKPMKSINLDDEEVDDDEAAYEFRGNSKTLSPSPGADKRNVSSVSVSSGENSEDSGLVSEKRTPVQAKSMSYVTEIKVSDPPSGEEGLSDNEEIISIMEGSSKPTTSANTTVTMMNVTSNGKLPAGKKPPVPPRRSDATRYVPTRNDPDQKQIVYVSEYKSPVSKTDDSSGSSKKNNWSTTTSVKQEEPEVKEEDEEREINPWGSSPSQPVVNLSRK